MQWSYAVGSKLPARTIALQQSGWSTPPALARLPSLPWTTRRRRIPWSIGGAKIVEAEMARCRLRLMEQGVRLMLNTPRPQGSDRPVCTRTENEN